MTTSINPQPLFRGLASVAFVIVVTVVLVMAGCSDQEGTTGASSGARLVKEVGHYNIVKFNKVVYGVPHGIAVDWPKDDLEKVAGMITGSSVDLVEKSIRNLPPQEASPGARLVKEVGHYNIVKFNKVVYGVPHGIAVDWPKDDLEKVAGIITGSSVDLVEKSIRSLPPPQEASPGARLVKEVGHYNIVKFNKVVYGVPHGIAVDWPKDDLEKVVGIITGSSVDLVEKSIRSLPPPQEASVLEKVAGMITGSSVDPVEKSIRNLPPQEASPGARFVKEVGDYNIVKFNKVVYGVPHGIAVDWPKDDLEKVVGIITGSSVDLVEKSIRSLPPPQEASPGARLVKEVGHYNIVKFNKVVYGVPHGIAVDWPKDDLEKVVGIITGSSVDLVEKSIRSLPPPQEASVLEKVAGMITGSSVDPVEKSIRNLPPQEASPGARFVKEVGDYNIVKFNKVVYGVPHGIAVDWPKDDLEKVAGIITGSSVDLVEKSIRSLPPPQEASPGARLVKEVGHYNIVKFNKVVYGVPHGIAVDWPKDDLEKVVGIITGSSVDLVEKSIRSLPPPQEASILEKVVAFLKRWWG